MDGWWTIKSVSVLSNDEDVRAFIDSYEPRLTSQYQSFQFQHVPHETRLAPTQARIIPLHVLQIRPYHQPELHFRIALESSSSSALLDIVLPIKHHSQWTANSSPPDGITASYFFASSMPTAFLVVPPIETNSGEPRPPVLTLREFFLFDCELSF